MLRGQLGTNLTLDVIVAPDETTAIEGQDYMLLNNVVSLGPETMEATVSVEIVDDSLIEERERFSIEVLNCCNVSIQPSRAIISIEDNGERY